MKKTIIVTLATLTSLSTFAAQTLSFDEIKLACQEPAKFHNQIAPSSIQVSCRDMQLKWVPAADGAIQMQTARTMDVAVISDKYEIAPLAGELETSPQTFACAQYKQISEVVDTSRAVSCEELIAFSGSGIEFCAGAVNTLRAANLEAIVTTDTGLTASLCATPRSVK